ncbi:hypothetical protein [Candidatus Uabimicrobium amorphum]|uniref:Uncharacterized protein n=1 Tax=Uabimicrobium amorphum TaxID=2596890 RepID=A0A5S9IQ27_UABAM|nr:hypothetical protein [Candidatus Uabimicrobium amorphum]BBM85979.1 hypothetical protein UABAM_04365 [Candidatus Uabimicrobium amorphum]
MPNIIQPLLQQHADSEFLFAILQWKAFYADDHEWNNITSHLWQEAQNNNKMAAYYLHKLTSSNDICLSHVKKLSQMASRTLLNSDYSRQVDWEEYLCSLHEMDSLFHETEVHSDFDQSLFCASTLQSVLASFDVTKSILLKYIYRGKLGVDFRDNYIVFVYSQVSELFHCKNSGISTMALCEIMQKCELEDSVYTSIANGEIAVHVIDNEIHIPQTAFSSFLTPQQVKIVEEDDDDDDDIVFIVGETHKDKEPEEYPSIVILPYEFTDRDSAQKKFYSWDEALKRLQIENEDLERFITDGDIQAYTQDGEIIFSCEEIDRWISTLMDDKTIVMPGSSGDVVVEDEEAISLSLPMGLDAPMPKKETYSLDQSLDELQIEAETLEEIVAKGEIETQIVDGELRLVQEDVDKYRQQKQADQTIVMPLDEELVEEEDDEFVPIVTPTANKGKNIALDLSSILEEDGTAITVDLPDVSDELGTGELRMDEEKEVEDTPFESIVIDPQESVIADKTETKQDDVSFKEKEMADSFQRSTTIEPEEPVVDQMPREADFWIDGEDAVMSTIVPPRGGKMPDSEMETTTRARRSRSVAAKKRGKKRSKKRQQLYRKVKKQIGQRLAKKYQKNIGQVTIPTFEGMLSEEAGQPGPIERILAQSQLLLKSIQVTIGLRVLTVINFADNVTEFVAGYITNIYRTWKMTKSIQRRLQRNNPQQQISELQKDLDVMRYQLSRLLTFPEFCLREHKPQQIDSEAQTFALKLVIELRGHLDEMKRDLALLTPKQAAATAQKTAKDFLLSFIPNPLELATPCKDFIILVFFMKYSRKDIEVMYIDLLSSYSDILSLINEEPFYRLEMQDYERKILHRLQREIYCLQDIEKHIEECRLQLQRFIQLLCCVQKFIDPRYWHIEDIFYECKNRNDYMSAKFLLEWEKWVTAQLRKQLKNYHCSTQEKSVMLKEEIYFRRRYKLQRKLTQNFM